MKLNLIIGPMFSGKSTRLIEEIEKNIRAKNKCLVIRHSIDCRSPPNILQTHSGIIFNNCIINQYGIICDSLDFIVKNDVDIIAIDEGQFFNTTDMLVFIDKCRLIQKIKKIYISGLNGDFKREPFDTITKLIPLCTKIIFLSAICDCGQKAHFSKRIIKNSNLILVGGDESYISTCLNCYFK